MASLKDVERVTDDLENLVGDLKKELKNGDFDRLIQLADEISEHADEAAGTFATVNEALMGRINELSGRNSNQKSGSRS
jgi:ABC-type transporter Mla subunit MlaD